MAALKSHPRTTIKLRNRARLSIVKKCIYYGIRVLVYMFSTATSCPKEVPKVMRKGDEENRQKACQMGGIQTFYQEKTRRKPGNSGHLPSVVRTNV
jgi:hypothetical protein